MVVAVVTMAVLVLVVVVLVLLLLRAVFLPECTILAWPGPAYAWQQLLLRLPCRAWVLLRRWRLGRRLRGACLAWGTLCGACRACMGMGGRGRRLHAVRRSR